jgi:hypothetical protein
MPIRIGKRPPATPSIGFVLSVVLAVGAGCGRTRALSVPSGAVVGTGDRPVAAPASRDGGADASAAMALDASGAPDSVAAELDAGTDASPSLPANQYRAIALAVGRLHNCALLDDHRVKCWGTNASGELGLGDTMNRGADPATMGDNLPTVDLGTGRTAKAIATGMYTSCATLDDDTLKCWGVGNPNNPNGAGALPGEMGDHLKPIDLGVGRKPVAVAVGWSQTCVALDDGSFLCWSGAQTTKVAAPIDGARVVQFTRDFETVGVFDDGSVRKVSNVSPNGPTPIDFGGRLATFVAGSASIGDTDCVVLQAGGTACAHPHLSLPLPSDASVVAIAITEYEHACGLDSSGAVTCWYLGGHPEWRAADGTSHVPLAEPATSIGAGDYNGCALLTDGTVKCWWIDSGPFPDSLGGSVATPTDVSAVDLGTRPTP